jgi:hypothetical protein
MQWRVSREPVEENGLPEIVLIAVEIADGVVDRVAVADEAADGVDAPVAAVGAVATVDRDTKGGHGFSRIRTDQEIEAGRDFCRGLFYKALTFG